MAFQLRRVDYFCMTVAGETGHAYELLEQLVELGIDMLAFAAIPSGPEKTQLTIFPGDSGQLQREGERAGFDLEGPHPAILAQGDDEMGALARVHRRLHEAAVNVYASSGVADGRGGYGYVIYVRPEDHVRAVAALGL
jgi:hypothetical protein